MAESEFEAEAMTPLVKAEAEVELEEANKAESEA